MEELFKKYPDLVNEKEFHFRDGSSKKVYKMRYNNGY